MESETSNGCFRSEKITTSDHAGSLGLKLQRTGSFPYQMITHQNRQIESGSGGPGFDVYDGIGGGGGGGAGGCGVSRSLQPFRGIMAAASLKYPFTCAQWMELERQALIFKHMKAAVPIPPDLLRNFSDTALAVASASHPALARGTCFNLRFANNADPEPGRCRRTDGKKWRCSRDVAPDQKYCERHMHRGRPRSRKHVEVQSEISNNINNSNTHSITSGTLTAKNASNHLGTSRPYNQPSEPFSEPDFKIPPFESMVSATPYKDSRSTEWMLKGSSVPMASSNQDLQQLMQGKPNSITDLSALPQQYQENLNLNSYTNFGEASQQNDQCCLFLSSELAPLDDPLGSDQRQMPRRFIDAWSTARDTNPTLMENKSSTSSNAKLSPSTLSLSMSGDNGRGVEEDMDQIHMDLNVIDSACNNGSGNTKSAPLNWMTPGSWIASPPGGPLGEVLQSSAKGSNANYPNSHSRSSSSGGGLNLMTEGWGGSNEPSPRATDLITFRCTSEDARFTF